MSLLSRAWEWLKSAVCKVLGYFGLCEESKSPEKEKEKEKEKSKKKSKSKK